MYNSSRGFQEKFVDIDKAPGVNASQLENGELRAMHVSWQAGECAYATRCSLAEGYMLYLTRCDLAPHPNWVDGRSAPLRTLNSGQSLLLDLRAQHSALVTGDVDCVSVYTSSAALLRFQAEHDLPCHGLLHAPENVIHDDGVLRHLGEALLPALQQPKYASKLYVNHLTLALLFRLTTQHAADDIAKARLIQPLRGGLASWQERRAKEMLLASMDGGIGLEELAAQCQLSRSHFARAFKASTGLSPLRWLAKQRLERVKVSLKNTNLSLAEIAASCGFADASHLTRVFIRETGHRPGAWRRERRR
ncbi:AraC family transcriptional regulator [Mesorhizobium sp. WSM4906]|uniref:helix-turn-helix domain-containing protein n=1 Tax=Mesorhizobium sp. WSM4906 TaxID=3038546 RepID=UPI0024171AF9|nr:AraC family transcriptional regulator [Mesorhizobium sp. WSM4906]WFP73698.1 AraC family transcriptional regulator [Mesorhizobium sp. WSM4906]